MQNENIDEIEKAIKKEIKTKEEIIEELKSNDPIKPNNKDVPEGHVHLGEIGTFKMADPDDVIDVFSHLKETVFQFKSCLFKINEIDENSKSFTAEMLN